MKSEDTPFEGGPMDGRVLPVLLGITGHPPKTYRIPVPESARGPATVLVYRRAPRSHRGRTGLTRGWKYVHDPGGDRDEGPRWPWSRRAAHPDTAPDTAPDATPGGKPDDAHG